LDARGDKNFSAARLDRLDRSKLAGGVRAIYLNLTEQEVVLLVAAYSKADRANKAPIEIRKVV